MNKSNNQTQALLLALACFSLWTVGDILVKLVAEYHVPIYEMMALHGLLTSFLIFIFVASRRRLAFFKPKNKKLLILRAIGVVFIIYCNFNAFRLMPLADFYVIAFTSPFMVALLAWALLKERLSIKQIGIILLGFMGAVIAIAPWATKETGSMAGYVYAGLGAVLFSGTQIILRFLTKTEHKESMMLFTRLFVGFVGAAMTLFAYVPLPLVVYGYLFCAAFVSLMADMAMITAMQKARDAASISSLHYSQLVTGALAGYVIWRDIPMWNIWAGGAVIIGAGFIMAHITRKQNALTF